MSKLQRSSWKRLPLLMLAAGALLAGCAPGRLRAMVRRDEGEAERRLDRERGRRLREALRASRQRHEEEPWMRARALLWFAAAAFLALAAAAQPTNLAAARNLWRACGADRLRIRLPKVLRVSPRHAAGDDRHRARRHGRRRASSARRLAERSAWKSRQPPVLLDDRRAVRPDRLRDRARVPPCERATMPTAAFRTKSTSTTTRTRSATSSMSCSRPSRRSRAEHALCSRRERRSSYGLGIDRS